MLDARRGQRGSRAAARRPLPGADQELMGDNALGRFDRVATGLALAVVAASVLALGVLALL